MPYRIDPSRVTYREIRTESPPPVAALAWLLLKLKVPIPSSSDHPAFDELEPHRIHSSDVPKEVVAELEDSKEQLEALGFRGTVYHHFLDPRSRTEIYYASYLHKSGKVIARVMRRVFSANTPPKKNSHCAFITPLTHGRTLATANCKGDLEGPEECVDECLGNVSIQAAWKRHRERLQEPAYRESIQTIGDGRELLAALQQRHEVITKHFVDRKLFVPVEDTPPPTAAALAPAEAPAPAEETGAIPGADPLLLSEVRKLEDKQPATWATSLWVLVGTIALFFALGGAVWSWRFTLLLIPILLFHEAGHFLAMKLFDYRNVRMFFIPLFGAAVTGRHYDVPGWKRVVTSLMGPVPGIFLGIGLGVVGVSQGIPLLIEAATLTIILNGFNLLPALPLDGGWVMHGLLFSRHAFLDLLFRLMAIGLLFLLAFVGSKVMLYVGIAMIIGLPMAFNMARITDRLRADSKPLGRPVDGHAPANAVTRIGAEIDKAYPKGIDVRNKARLALQVYENVNSRPPGWLATLTLGAVYVGSFLTACVAGVLFALAQQADFGQFLFDAALGPQAPITSQDIESHPLGAFDPAEAAWGDSLVVNFESDEAAREALGSVGPDETAMRFGGTLVLKLADAVPDGANDDDAEDDDAGLEADRDALFERFESQTEDLFLADDGAVFVEYFAVAPTPEVAEEICELVSHHSMIPEKFRPLAPWEEGVELTEAQRLARKTAALAMSHEWFSDVTPNEELYEQLFTAQQRGRDKVVEQIQKRIAASQEAARRKYLDGLRERPEGEIDLAVLAAFQEALDNPPEADEDDDDTAEFEDEEYYDDMFPTAPDPESWMAPIAERFGCEPADAPPNPRADARHGYGEANGPTFNLSINFKSLPAGPVALLRWLEEKGCTSLKYRLSKSWM